MRNNHEHYVTRAAPSQRCLAQNVIDMTPAAIDPATSAWRCVVCLTICQPQRVIRGHSFVPDFAPIRKASFALFESAELRKSLWHNGCRYYGILSYK